MAEVNEYITAGIIAIVIILLIGGGVILQFFPQLHEGILDSFDEAKDIFREEWKLTEPEIKSNSVLMFEQVFDSVKDCADRSSNGCLCEIDRGDFADSRYQIVIQNFEVGAKAVIFDQDEAPIAEYEFPGEKIGTLMAIEGDFSNTNNLYCYYGKINIKFKRSVQEEPDWVFADPISQHYTSVDTSFDEEFYMDYYETNGELLKTEEGICFITTAVSRVYDLEELAENYPYALSEDKELVIALEPDTGGFLSKKTNNLETYLQNKQFCA